MAPFCQTTNRIQDAEQVINPVRLELSNNNREAFIHIEIPEVFYRPMTAQYAMDQLRYAILAAARIINNPNANIHVHCVALNQELMSVYNITTPSHRIGHHPLYDELVRITRITRLELATQMLQRQGTNLQFQSVYYHVSM